MGTWAKDTAGVWTLAGDGVATVVVAPTFMPKTCSLKIQAAKPGDEVGACFWMSPDGRSRFRSRVSGTDWVVEKVDFGDTVTVVDTAAHGLAAGVPFIAETRIRNNKIEVYLNGSASALLTYDNSSGNYIKHRHWGFDGTNNGAKVLSAVVCDLVADPAGQTEVLVWVSGGDLYFSPDGEQASLLKSGAFRQTGPVSLTAFENFVLGTDAAVALKVDLDNLTVEPYGGSTLETALPGATETAPGSGVFIPGTTTMTFFSSFVNRVVASDGQELYMSAIADIDDWNAGSDRVGRAFATPVDLPGRIGERIVSFTYLGGQEGIIGCRGSAWSWRGDPAIALPDIKRIEKSSGVSSKDAIILAEEGRAVYHSPDGAMTIPVGRGVYSFSSETLTEGIQVPQKDVGSYITFVLRDSTRRRTYFFITPTDEAQAGLHFSYNERVGKYNNGIGAFFPYRMPARIGPTCGVIYKGEVLLWTRDGYVLKLDNATANDDGEAIDFRFTALLDEPDVAMDTALEEMRIVLGTASADLKFTVYVANTAEQVMLGPDRFRRYSGTAQANRPARPFDEKVSGAAIAVDFRQSTLNKRVAIEAIQVVTRSEETLHRHRRAAKPSPPAQCAPPPFTAPSDPGGFDPPTTPPINYELYFLPAYAFLRGQQQQQARRYAVESLSGGRHTNPGGGPKRVGGGLGGEGSTAHD